MILACPGSQKFKQPYPETVKCPFCGAEAEIWTDEVQAVCPDCKKAVTRKLCQSCIDWCPYAKECIGEEKYSIFKFIK